MNTTWGIIESGKNKKRSETQALNVEDKKITDQQTIVETFNEYVGYLKVSWNDNFSTPTVINIYLT